LLAKSVLCSGKLSTCRARESCRGTACQTREANSVTWRRYFSVTGREDGRDWWFTGSRGLRLIARIAAGHVLSTFPLSSSAPTTTSKYSGEPSCRQASSRSSREAGTDRNETKGSGGLSRSDRIRVLLPLEGSTLIKPKEIRRTSDCALVSYRASSLPRGCLFRIGYLKPSLACSAVYWKVVFSCNSLVYLSVTQGVPIRITLSSARDSTESSVVPPNDSGIPPFWRYCDSFREAIVSPTVV